MRPDLHNIDRARALLQRHLPVTRMVSAPSLTRRTGANVYLKLESELPTGSFKPRGALYALHSNLERRRVREVIASSTGNHGAAVAYAARLLGVAATIFLPEKANPVKRSRIEELGAKIVERGQDIAAAFQNASAYAGQDGVYFLNDATDPEVPAGTATIAAEILEQLPQADIIYVPMGDTALIRGIGAALRASQSKVRLIGVQAEKAPSYYLSWKRGEVVSTESCDTIADGLATRTPDPGNVGMIRELVDEVCLVSESEMLAAIKHLLLEEHVVAEPAGAAAPAALLKHALLTHKSDPGKNVVLIVSGANVAPELLGRAICE